MELVVVIKTVTIMIGITFLYLAFRAYARQNLTESMGVSWGIFSVILILIGSVVAKRDFPEFTSLRLFLFFAAAFLLLISILFGISVAVSRLRIKNQELAMQVSLLNQENERILHQLKALSIEEESNKKKG